MVDAADIAPGTPRHVDQILRLRRARADLLGAGLFSDPAWDILLQLYAAALRGRKIELTGVVTDVPRSTLARWAVVLEEHGLVRCEAASLSTSSLPIALTPSGSATMSDLFAKLYPLA